MNGRWYGGQQLEVSPWDGVTNYQVEETDQEREARVSAWEKFLEEEDKTTAEEQTVSYDSFRLLLAMCTLHVKYYDLNIILFTHKLHEIHKELCVRV